MALIDSTNLMAWAVFGSQIPKEGPKAVPIRLDFSAADTYTLDLGNRQHLGAIQLIQSIFVDTSLVDVNLTVLFNGANQLITIKGRTNGYYTVLAANPVNFIFTCPAGGAVVTVALLNFPVASAQWPATP